jgi:hypothetical protein
LGLEISSFLTFLLVHLTPVVAELEYIESWYVPHSSVDTVDVGCQPGMIEVLTNVC